MILLARPIAPMVPLSRQRQVGLPKECNKVDDRAKRAAYRLPAQGRIMPQYHYKLGKATRLSHRQGLRCSRLSSRHLKNRFHLLLSPPLQFRTQSQSLPMSSQRYSPTSSNQSDPHSLSSFFQSLYLLLRTMKLSFICHLCLTLSVAQSDESFEK